MTLDTITGLLIALIILCMGGLFAMLAMYWLGLRDEGPGRRDSGEPGPPPPIEPHVEIPDHVPQDWVDQAA
jgi:hypothetical protein